MLASILPAILLAVSGLGDFRHDPDPELRRLSTLPRDVRVHIGRQINCDHWLGEEPYDADRRREIDHAVRALRCEVLDREERRLRRRYARSPAVLKAISEARPAL